MKKRVMTAMMAAVTTAMMLTGVCAADQKAKTPNTKLEQEAAEDETEDYTEAEETETEESAPVQEDEKPVLDEETDKKLRVLVEEENQIYSDNEELWGKILSHVDNVEAEETMDNGGAYIDIIQKACDDAKDSLTEEEQKKMQKDLKRIEEIEKQIAELMPEENK